MEDNYISEVFLLDDKSFIVQVYKLLLGREPDHAGLEYYQKRLGLGYSRISIIDQIYRSPECLKNQSVVSARNLLRSEWRRRHWFWRWFKNGLRNVKKEEYVIAEAKSRLEDIRYNIDVGGFLDSKYEEHIAFHRLLCYITLVSIPLGVSRDCFDGLKIGFRVFENKTDSDALYEGRCGEVNGFLEEGKSKSFIVDIPKLIPRDIRSFSLQIDLVKENKYWFSEIPGRFPNWFSLSLPESPHFLRKRRLDLMKNQKLLSLFSQNIMMNRWLFELSSDDFRSHCCRSLLKKEYEASSEEKELVGVEGRLFFWRELLLGSEFSKDLSLPLSEKKAKSIISSLGGDEDSLFLNKSLRIRSVLVNSFNDLVDELCECVQANSRLEGEVDTSSFDIDEVLIPKDDDIPFLLSNFRSDISCLDGRALKGALSIKALEIDDDYFTWSEKAAEFYNRGDYSEAQYHWWLCVSAYPYSHVAARGYAQALFAQGNYVDAELNARNSVVLGGAEASVSEILFECTRLSGEVYVSPAEGVGDELNNNTEMKLEADLYPDLESLKKISKIFVGKELDSVAYLEMIKSCSTSWEAVSDILKTQEFKHANINLFYILPSFMSGNKVS